MQHLFLLESSTFWGRYWLCPKHKIKQKQPGRCSGPWQECWMGWSWKVLFNPDHSVIVLGKIILVPIEFCVSWEWPFTIQSQHKEVLFWWVKTGTRASQGQVHWPRYQICHSVQEPVKILRALLHSLSNVALSAPGELKKKWWLGWTFFSLLLIFP